MRAIVGIGNPGSSYLNNRHNVGFQFLDFFSDKHKLFFKPSKFDFYFAEGKLLNNPFLLVKPTSYVNNSGIPVSTILKEYNIPLDNLLVIVDDINLPLGSFRLRKSGGDGGHNGLSSIIYHLNSKNFARLRIGIGNKFVPGEMPDFVLSDFNNEEHEVINKVFQICIGFIEDFVSDGIQKMFNSYSNIIKKNKSEENSNFND